MVQSSGTPRRVLYQGPPGSPTGTLYEVVGEVALVQNPPTAAGPSQSGLLGSDAASHLSPGPRIGPAHRTRPGPRSDAELRIERRLRIGVSPMRTMPLRHLLRIAKCCRSLLHPQGQPPSEIRGLLWADIIWSGMPEAILPRLRASEGV